jgi:predicted CopG family antitoxin
MSTKTISLKLEAYERLRRARRSAGESFSDVVMRAEWPDRRITAGELRAIYEVEGAHFGAKTLDGVEEAKAADGPPEDKWANP